MIKIFLVALFVCAVSAKSVEIKFCDDKLQNIESVDVTPCNGNPCTFKPGMNVTLTAIFNSEFATKTAAIGVTVDFLGIEVDVPGLDPNACNYLKCPLTANTKYNFKYPIVVSNQIIDIGETTLTFKVSGDDDKVIACAKTQVVIQ